MSNGYIGGACPYKNNGFGGGDAHAPHICRCENQLVVAFGQVQLFLLALFGKLLPALFGVLIKICSTQPPNCMENLVQVYRYRYGVDVQVPGGGGHAPPSPRTPLPPRHTYMFK